MHTAYNKCIYASLQMIFTVNNVQMYKQMYNYNLDDFFFTVYTVKIYNL